MTKLSEFFGIQISIRTRERPHRLPHFHARYGAESVSIAIETLEVLAGNIERRALAMVLEWAVMHRGELQLAWDAVKAGRIPKKIEPLR